MNLVAPAVKRFYYLDSARGLAALSVTTWHFFTAFLDFNHSWLVTFSPFHFFWYGEADVVFFFLHSGFILGYAYTSVGENIRVSSYIRFLIERLFRIYPLFLFILLLSFVLKQLIFPVGQDIHTGPHLRTFWADQTTLGDLMKQAILFVRIPSDINLRLIPQDWTLTVEILVGALVPALAYLLKKTKLFFLLIILLAARLLHLSTYIIEFGSGLFLFYHWDRILNYWKRLGVFYKWLFLALATALYCCFFYFPSLFNLDRIFIRPFVDRLIVLAGCSIFFCSMISSPQIQRILTHSILVRIGKICYSLYLVHMLVLICFGNYFMQLLSGWLSFPPIANLLICFIVYMTVTLLLSILSYSLIEQPFNKFGKRIGRQCEKFLKEKFQLRSRFLY